MKRDIDYIRELLLELESCESVIMYVMGDKWSDSDNDDAKLSRLYDKENDKKSYHIRLLQEAGYHDIFHLTWEAHEFIEVIRDQEIWEKTKRAISETGGNATLEMVKNLAEGFLKQKISQHSGIEL